MIRLFCMLSERPDPATVIQYVIQSGSGFNGKRQLPPPQFLIIEAAEDKPDTGALLYRFDGRGDCVGDTWHKTVEDAQKNASAEYGHLIRNWQKASDDIDLNVLIETLKLQSPSR